MWRKMSPYCCPCRPLGNVTFYEDKLVVGTYNQKQPPDPSLQINAARNQQILLFVRDGSMNDRRFFYRA